MVPPIPELPPLICMAAIGLAVAILLYPALFGGKSLGPADAIFETLPWSKGTPVAPSNYLLIDQYLNFAPLREFFHDEAIKGRFPLWNPHLMSGVPSIASMQGAALYPVNLLLLPIDPFVASGIAAFVKLFVAGLFTFLYLRRLGVVSTAGLVAGVTFAFSGFLVVWLGHPHANAAVMLPALFYFVEGAVAGPRSPRPWIGLALAFAVMILGGHAPTAVHVTLALVAYAIFRILSARLVGRWMFGLSLACAMVAGFLIAAPQVFPFVEYYQISSSAQSTEAVGRWASHLQPATLFHFLLPNLTGSPVAGFEHLPQALGLAPLENFNERTGYVGILAIFLGCIAVWRRRCAFSVFFAGTAIVAATIIYGVPPWPSIMKALPIMSGINHERLLLVLGWCAAVLAGLGADTLFRARSIERPRVLAVVFVSGIAAVLLALWISVGGVSRLDGASRSFLAVQIAVLAGGIAAVMLTTWRRIAPKWVAAVCIGWTAFDLLWFARGYNPAVPRAHYYPPTGAIRFLQADPSVFRVFGVSTVLIPDTAEVFGLQDIRGRDFTSIARYEELVTGRAGDFFFFQTAKAVPTSLALLNAKYVLLPERRPDPPADFELVYDAEIAIYRHMKDRGRAMIVFDHQVEPNPAVLLKRVREEGFDPAQTVWLEEQPVAPPVEAGLPGAGLPTEARITQYEPGRVRIEAQLPKPGFLLLLDSYFPGWTATVDGRDAHIYRADYAFRAVALPAGAHSVTFEYRPLSFRLGLGVSALVLGVLGVLWFRSRRRAAP